MPNNPGATPRLDSLLRVVPVVESRQLGGAHLLVVSLESYREGFLLHTQLRYSADHHRTPELLLEAADDPGRRYGCWSSGGYGGGGPDGYVWRRDYVFAPAPDADAGALRVRVAAIEWVGFDPAAPRPTVASTDAVDWTITIPLH